MATSSLTIGDCTLAWPTVYLEPSRIPTPAEVATFLTEFDGARKAEGWSVSETAENLGLGEATVYAWFAGRKEPSAESARRVELRFGIRNPWRGER